jgi:Spy/CpxP family protein refolding chaperone
MKMQFATLMMAGAMTLVAQGPFGSPPGGQQRTSAVKDYLGLSDDQMTQLANLRTAERQANQTLFEQLRARQTSLRGLLDSGSTDAAAIGKLQIEIETLRKQLDQNRSRFDEQAKAVLTATQQAKLKTLEDATALQPAIAGAGALGLLERRAPAGGMMGRGAGLGPGLRRQPRNR